MIDGKVTCRQSILIVDDDLSTRELISDAITQAGFYHLTEVDNGIAALKLFQKDRHDLVISDLKMPGMGGIELLHKIKGIDPTTSVIIMTGYPSIDVSIAAMKYGAVDFLAKPFKIDDLIFKVKLYLKEKVILAEQDTDLKINNSKLTQKIRELSTISYIFDSIEKAAGSNDDIFQEIAELALTVAGGEQCLLVLFDEANHLFHKKVMKSRKNGADNADHLIASLEVIFNDVIRTRRAVIRNTFDNSEFFNSLLCVPLMIRNKVFGLLTLVTESNGHNFTQTDLNYISNLTTRASLNIENGILYESIFANIMDTFKSLVHSIHVRDHYTERHSINVTRLTVKTARTMQLEQSEIECLEISSMLHDIGKIAIPDNVLLKPGRLTDEEYETIKTHPTIGESILRPINLLEAERKIMRHHHERWDGRGYPDGLSSEDIPFLSRILSVADAYDAMTSDRPYRKGLLIDEAVGELKRNRSLQFDKNIVDVFIAVLRE